MRSELIYKKNGAVHRVGRGSTTSNAFYVIDGIVHTYASDALDEPYLKEWGWTCSNEDEKELYRWLYRCMYEGLTVSKRTVKVDGEEVSFATDGKKSGTDEIKEDVISRIGNANIFNKIMSDAYTTFLRIPVVQFGITDDSILYTMCQRVINDNPLLIFPFFHSFPDSVAVIKDESGVCQYIYSAVPIEDKRCQAQDVCMEQIENIVEKVREVYGIQPGDSLTVAQKAKILKVIHDCIILIGNQEDGTLFPWLLATPYAVYDERYKGNCTSYTMAFCVVARMYGIEAINMTGFAYIDTDGTQDGYELMGEHSWVAVRLSDEEYGTYPIEPEKWSCIDTYWDEPALGIGSYVSPREDVQWRYFLDMGNINAVSANDAVRGNTCRVVDAAIEYGCFPMEDIPKLSMPYEGNELYIWEDEL